ncbi:MAG: DUF4912 domain-containing protein [Candidatus Omnitrophica bacterium]|nr:DUF4912 domain-containing protein [Candidatus Omnitrophota bacterium]
MKTDLKKLKKDELLALAEKHNIPSAARLKKADLIKALSADKSSVTKIVHPQKKTVASTKTERKPTATRSRTKKASTQAPVQERTKKTRLDDLTVMHQETQHIHSHISQPHDHVQTFRAGTGELPDSYDETKLVVMVRDPYWAYSYWDISNDTRGFIDRMYREREGVRPVLRVHDVTGVNFNGNNGNSSWDLDISIDARNWYLNLGVPGGAFVIDLGLKDKNGDFILIARSNKIQLPIDYPSSVIDEEWMISDLDFDELYALSGGLNIGLSSGELKKKKKQLFKFHDVLSSVGLASPSGVKEKKPRAFFLEIDTEIILYGRTYSDAKVTVEGKPVKLRPDGTFSLRYHLPDGVMRLPVKAISSDGVDERQKSVKVNKETK